MRTFAERNLVVLGAVGIGVTVGVVVLASEYTNLPFINSDKHYSAYFAEAGGLRNGAAVQVAGLRVGEVSSIELDGAQVLVTFSVNKDVHLGDRTEAAIKTKSLLGVKILTVTSRGDGRLSGIIPVDRTKSPYQLPDALGDLASTVKGLDLNQVSQSMTTLSDTFRDSPPELKIAVDGVARFSQTLNERDAQLRDLLRDAKASSGVLAERSDQVARLITDANTLLAQLQAQSAALDQISGNISSLARQLSATIADNRTQLRPALDKLNGVLTIVDNRKQRLQKAITLFDSYAMKIGESVASGPFFKAYIANLLPGQFIQPFVDAAFSDLGLDPNVLTPAELTDPQTGQPGTPALPVPYPRTGQGGEPRQTLPDAITGKTGDSRYPYRAPLPAPPPGGPPPGPPATTVPAPEEAGQ
ncbi:MCE family protein [Mycolicibacterium sp. CH28]|uniref:MCE family protein n=1 Tax=Mycolicibacterium sp. CH28 TaxID=2512237 RepID=UPI00108180EE|nr:MCE family protein [Mycolicibacterium sp. CH28]TGD89121.1 MCE family protein [Mycolicibacterium sp. CH28]